jgi:two-component system nitrogen regulation response regulator NtrX
MLQPEEPRPHRDAEILVVDDEPMIAQLLKKYLNNLGFRTRFAATGREALAALERALPDVMLLDIYMPGYSGVEVLRTLRARWPNDFPFGVIILTGSRHEPLLEEALALGAFEVLLKPIELTHLELALRTQLTLKPPRPRDGAS